MKRARLIITLVTVWPLLFGIGMLSMSNGLQGTLLGLRGISEGFSIDVIGVIMSVYFLGYLLGSRIVPNWIASVGHIRVFAALASIASTTILLHGVFVTPWLWIPVRAVTGFCFCGLFIIAESWLNQVSNKKQRGLVFALYIAIVNGGMLLGQFMINLAPLESAHLFILVSVLISLALAPITLTNKPAPRHRRPEPISFKEMFKRFPLPMVGVFISGIANSSIIGLAPVFADMTGLSKGNIALFMAFYILGNASLPIVLGAISDRMDRRSVIEAAAAVGVITSICLYFMNHNFALILLLGGMITSLYSVSITYMNDQIKKTQIIAASRSLIMFNAIGAMIGPLIGGFALSRFGPDSFFALLACYLTITFAMAVYRHIVGKTVKKKREFVHVTAFAAPSAMRLQPEAPLAPPKQDTGNNTARKS